MNELDNLISFAKRQEAEKSLFPLWLATTTISKLNNTDCIGFDDFVNSVVDPNNDEMLSNKAPEDIVNEFLPIVENDRKKVDTSG